MKVKVGHKIYSWFYNRTGVLQFIAIFLVFLSVGFKVTKTEKKWIWMDYPFFALVFVGIAIFFVSVWIKIEKNKLLKKINEIKRENTNKKDEYIQKMNELTPRQNEVLELIIDGKTNKEIIETLFIEHSTLKTHINKIYKTLDIRNRQELRKKHHKHLKKE